MKRRALPLITVVIIGMAACSGPSKTVTLGLVREVPTTTTAVTTTIPPTTTTTVVVVPPTTIQRTSTTQRVSRSADRPVPSSHPTSQRVTFEQVDALIRGCECSDGHCDNPTYRGYYQFSYATWRAAGGTGDPQAASFEEQQSRANWLFYNAEPRRQWPICYPRALHTLGLG